jgi:hypothetical protein
MYVCHAVVECVADPNCSAARQSTAQCSYLTQRRSLRLQLRLLIPDRCLLC